MAVWGSVDFSDFVALRDRIEKLKNVDLNAFCIQVTNQIAGDFLDGVVDKTPVDTGSLKGAWTIGEIQKIGDTYIIEVINPLEYAEYVEFGHRQEPGRYVKAIGKRLKKSWVEGKHMLRDTERELQRDIPKIIELKLEKLLEGVINGK